VSVSRVHVVVVAYGAVRELDTSLSALGAAFPVTVVDNSSSTDVGAVAEARDANYVDAGANLGFGAGVNIALSRLEQAPPEYVLLLNPDAILAPAELERLTAYLDGERNSRVAAASPALVGRDGVRQRVVWPFPSPWRAWVEAFGLGRRLPSRQTFVIGAVLLLRWSAIVEVGLFDERFFLYAEEMDWQRRATDLKWRSSLCAEVVAVHSGAGASADPVRREALFHAGQETYIRKWFGSRGWWSYRSAAAFGAVVRAMVLRGERKTAARLRVKLYLRGPRRCAGLVASAPDGAFTADGA
jgi:GT2 family glycosyltransferase